MASLDLLRLWKLHQIDEKIIEVRKRAAALDGGKDQQTKLDALMKRDSEEGVRARELSSELLDLELSQKTINDKIAKIEKDLFSGKIVNSREVENYEKEITALKRQRDSYDGRLMELYDLVPPAKAALSVLNAEIATVKAQLAEKRKSALATKGELEKAYLALGQKRPEVAKIVPAPLLARYESIRKNHGTGMAEVIKQKQCGSCGMSLPERTIATLQDDKIVTCEACHRVLYFSEGVI